MVRQIYILILLIAVANSVLKGQHLKFEQLTVKDGLPYNQVNDLMQDRQGFLWIGTKDGLNRYDGLNFKEFRHNADDTSSLSNNTIRKIFEDNSGNIWIATNMGLNVYSTVNNTIKRFINDDSATYTSSNFIINVLVDRLGQVWYSTYNGLYMMNQKTSEIQHFLPDSTNAHSISHRVVWEIFEDRDGLLWFGTNNGLSLCKNDGKFKFIQYLPDFGNVFGLQTDRVWSFCQTENGSIWLGSFDGLFRVSGGIHNLQFEQFKHDPDNKNSLSYNFVESLYAGVDNTIYAGTWNGGLNEIKTDGGAVKFYRYMSSPGNPFSISHNLVNALLVDRSSVLWVGTSGGLNRATLSGNKLITVNNSHSNGNNKSGHLHVNSILVDKKNNLLIGTRGNGLLFLPENKLNKSDFNFDVYNDNSQTSGISHNNIYGIFEDDDELWINTYNAINRVGVDHDGRPDSWKHFNTKDGLKHQFTYNIKKNNDGSYWVATYGQLSLMTIDQNDRNKVSFKNYDMDPGRADALVNATVFSLCTDKYGQLWIGTFAGLSKLVSAKGEGIFENYIYRSGKKEGLGGTQITTLYCDSKGRMWAGTEGGLSYFKQKSANEQVTFQTFGIKSGLPNDVIKSIIEDDYGKLWLGTNRGIAVFNPDKALSGLQAVEKVYNVDDGLQGNVFNERSVYKDQLGRLFFGGTNGFSIIDPAKIPENNSPPKIVFTDFKLFNQSVIPSDSNGGVLKKSINYTDTIVLTHKQNVISIEFAALDFVNPRKNEYAYLLEGINKDWVYTGRQNFATFTKLPPGKYMFLVKGTNNDGIWSDPPARILIISKPPFWKTWWAYLFYSLIFILLMVIFIRFRVNVGLRAIERQKAIQMARYEEREIIREKNAVDFHDELGHRLTKISLFLELASRQASKEPTINKYLNKVVENTTALSDGIRDLIWTIDPKKDSLYEILTRLQDFGDQLFEYSDITFRVAGINTDMKRIDIDGEKRKNILLLFKEAMNNSLKYSEASKSFLKIDLNGSMINISFGDNGKGFDIENTKKGYGLESMAKRAKKVKADYQLISTSGTKITISFEL